MIDPRDEPEDPLDEMLARSRDRAARYGAWLAQLRAGDPAFADASALYRPTWTSGSPPRARPAQRARLPRGGRRPGRPHPRAPRPGAGPRHGRAGSPGT